MWGSPRRRPDRRGFPNLFNHFFSRRSCVKYFRTGATTSMSSQRRPVEDVSLLESSTKNGHVWLGNYLASLCESWESRTWCVLLFLWVDGLTTKLLEGLRQVCWTVQHPLWGLTHWCPLVFLHVLTNLFKLFLLGVYLLVSYIKSFPKQKLREAKWLA